MSDEAERVLTISGASGLVGTALTRAARERGWEVRHLVRRRPREPHEFEWAPDRGSLDGAAIEGATALVGLSGASLSKLPWGQKYQRELVTSRMLTTTLLARALADADAPPARFVSASAVGFYGDAEGDAPLDESAPQGSGFLAELCRDWENAAMAASAVCDVTTIRTGIVLAEDAGVLPLVSRIAKFGGAGPLGPGTQHWPWITVDDHVRAILHILDAEPGRLTGPVNLVSPHPATAADVMRAVAREQHRPYWLPAPEFVLKAALGDGQELLLSNQPVVPAKLLASGFEFDDPELEPAIARLSV